MIRHRRPVNDVVCHCGHAQDDHRDGHRECLACADDDDRESPHHIGCDFFEAAEEA